MELQSSLTFKYPKAQKPINIRLLKDQFFLPRMQSKKRHEGLNAFVVATPCCFMQGGMTREILCLPTQLGGGNGDFG